MTYNTMFDVAFTVEHDEEDANDVPADVLIAGLEKRIANLKATPGEAREAFGVLDTYSTEEGGGV